MRHINDIFFMISMYVPIYFRVWQIWDLLHVISDMTSSNFSPPSSKSHPNLYTKHSIKVADHQTSDHYCTLTPTDSAFQPLAIITSSLCLLINHLASLPPIMPSFVIPGYHMSLIPCLFVLYVPSLSLFRISTTPSSLHISLSYFIVCEGNTDDEATTKRYPRR